jgi:hypothetical protein
VPDLVLSCHAPVPHDALVISLRGMRANLRVAVCKGHDYLDVNAEMFLNISNKRTLHDGVCFLKGRSAHNK